MADVVEKPNGKLMMRWRVEDATGALVRRAKIFDGKGGKRAALAEAARIEAHARVSDKVASTGTMTFDAFVETRLLPHQMAHTAARTYDTDRARIRAAMPYLGALRLAAIGPADIDAMTAAMLLKGGSRLYTRHHFNVVRSALRQASLWNIISGSPWRSAKVIHVPKARPKVATLAESDRLADAFLKAGKPIATALVTTLAETGARPGEVLALHWDQVDLEAGTIGIWRSLEAVGSPVTKAQTYRLKSTPKNDASVRVIRIGAGLVDTLRSLKVWHAEQHLKSGGAWPKDRLVFPNSRGGIWSVPHASRTIKVMADRLGVTTGSYSRRHGMASELLQAGVPVKTVSARMGHVDANMTLNRYAHLLPGADDVAVEVLERRRIH